MSYTDEPELYERVKKRAILAFAVSSVTVWIRSLYSRLHYQKQECARLTTRAATYASRARELNLKLVATENKLESLQYQLDEYEVQNDEVVVRCTLLI